VRSLKKVGGVWKFKAMAYGAASGMEPGHGPLTEQHNMQCAPLGAADVSAPFTVSSIEPTIKGTRPQPSAGAKFSAASCYFLDSY
jgi:hypothetical protein